MEKLKRIVRPVGALVLLACICLNVEDVNGIKFRPHGPPFIGPKYPYGRYPYGYHRFPKELYPKAYIEFRYPILHPPPKDLHKHPPPQLDLIHPLDVTHIDDYPVDYPHPGDHPVVDYAHPSDYSHSSVEYSHPPPGDYHHGPPDHGPLGPPGHPPGPPPPSAIIKETGPPGPVVHTGSSPVVSTKTIIHEPKPLHDEYSHIHVEDHPHPVDYLHSGGPPHPLDSHPLDHHHHSSHPLDHHSHHPGDHIDHPTDRHHHPDHIHLHDHHITDEPHHISDHPGDHTHSEYYPHGPRPHHSSGPPPGPPPHRGSTVVKETGPPGPVKHVSSSPVTYSETIHDGPKHSYSDDHSHHASPKHSYVSHDDHHSESHGHISNPPVTYSDTIHEGPKHSYSDDHSHSHNSVSHAAPKHSYVSQDDHHSESHGYPEDYSSYSSPHAPHGPSGHSEVGSRPPTILKEVGPPGTIQHVSSSPVSNSGPTIELRQDSGVQEHKYAYTYPNEGGHVEKLEAEQLPVHDVEATAYHPPSYPKEIQVELKPHSIQDAPGLEAFPPHDLEHDSYYSPSRKHSNTVKIPAPPKKPTPVSQNSIKANSNSIKRPLSKLDLSGSTNIPNSIDISFHSDAVSAPLVENIPAGPKDLYEEPKADVPVQPVEKIIRNTHLDEYIWVRREEGTPNIRLTLSSSSKSTFYIDDVQEGRKIHVVSKEGVCIQGVPYDGRKASAVECSNEDPLLRWNFVPIQHGKYWIQQKESNYCLQPSDVLTIPRFVELKSCDLYDPAQLWEIGSVYPIHEALKNDAYY